MKKGLMYSSSISNSEYEFADYTSPTPSQPLNLGKLTKLKASAVLNSQLMGIEESREQEHHEGQSQGPLLDKINYQESFLDPKNTDCIFGQSKLEFCRGVKTTSTVNYADINKQNSHQITYRDSKIKGLTQQNISAPVYTKRVSNRNMNDYTSLEIVDMMVSPYKSNMQLLLTRVSKTRKML